MDTEQKTVLNMYGRRLITVMHIIGDYLAVILAECTAAAFQAWFRVVPENSTTQLAGGFQYIYVPALFLLVMFISDGYRFNRPSLDVAKDIFKGICFSFLLYVLLVFFMRDSMLGSRLYTACFLGMSFLYITVFRIILRNLLAAQTWLQEPVLLVGAGKTAERLVNHLKNDACYCYRIIGMLDDHPVSQVLPHEYPVLGSFADAERIVKELGIKTLLIAAPGISEGRMKYLLCSVQHLTDTVLFTPNLVGIPMGSVEINTLFVEQLTIIKSKNNLSRRANRLVKFIFDMLLTSIGTIMISPLFIILMLLVGIENKGRIFFVHHRIGHNGKEFPCFKFQTMVNDADKALEKYLASNPAARKEWQETFKLEQDPRITRLGSFLRKTSLDELPQIFNVLRGEMSLVGPRPIVQEEVAKYGENIHEYYMVRPGITGMWQTSGRSNTTYEERVEMDTWYVRNWSVWLDVKYLLKTFSAVLKKEGAY